MLKRIGAGAAIAWAAPVVTSLHTPAFAQYECQGQCGGGIACDPNLCITGLNSSPGCASGSCYGGLGCFNALDTSGCCQNFQNEFCSCAAPCSSDSDCGP